MSDLVTKEQDLNELILSGELLPAFEKYYAEDVVMAENDQDPIIGKAANREREQQFLGSIEEVHNVELVGSAVGKDTSYSTWKLDVTFKDGTRAAYTQVAERRWRDGLVAAETFFHA